MHSHFHMIKMSSTYLHHFHILKNVISIFTSVMPLSCRVGRFMRKLDLITSVLSISQVALFMKRWLAVGRDFVKESFIFHCITLGVMKSFCLS